MARLQRLTERLTELLSDKNQAAITDILENIDATTATLKQRAPEMADAISDVRVAAHNAGVAANNIATLSNSANQLVSGPGHQAVENLNQAIISARQATDNLNAMISDARPGMQNFSKSTLPEANRLVRDLRDLSQSLQQVSDRVNHEGIGGALGPRKLPDYKPGKRQ
jgi:phospholipid/cholesterol/gamma-HCH transport system substrate-binding protein